MEGQRDIEKENLGGNVSRRKQGARSVGGGGNIIRPISERSESLDLIACAASKMLEVEGDLVSQPTGSAAHHDDVAADAGPAGFLHDQSRFWFCDFNMILHCSHGLQGSFFEVVAQSTNPAFGCISVGEAAQGPLHIV